MGNDDKNLTSKNSTSLSLIKNQVLLYNHLLICKYFSLHLCINNFSVTLNWLFLFTSNILLPIQQLNHVKLLYVFTSKYTRKCIRLYCICTSLFINLFSIHRNSYLLKRRIPTTNPHQTSTFLLLPKPAYNKI